MNVGRYFSSYLISWSPSSLVLGNALSEGLAILSGFILLSPTVTKYFMKKDPMSGASLVQMLLILGKWKSLEVPVSYPCERMSVPCPSIHYAPQAGSRVARPPKGASPGLWHEVRMRDARNDMNTEPNPQLMRFLPEKSSIISCV